MAASASGAGGGGALAMGTPMLIVVNVVSSVVLVAANKVLFAQLGWPFVTLLTAAHFLAGAAFFALASHPRFGLFKAATGVDRTRVWLLAGAGAASILASNFSLRLNSLGTFQILKATILLAVMLIALLQRDAKQVPTPREALAALLVCAGSVLSISSDISVTGAGLAVGVGSVLSTALFQLWSSSWQRALGVSAIQLLHASALPQGLLTLAASLALEVQWGARSAGAKLGPGAKDLFAYHYSGFQLGVALATCLIAIVLNYTAFAILGKTSAVTLQVTTQAKAVFILLLDAALYPRVAPEGGAGGEGCVRRPPVCARRRPLFAPQRPLGYYRAPKRGGTSAGWVFGL